MDDSTIPIKTLSLSKEEQQFLKDLVRQSVESYLAGETTWKDTAVPIPQSTLLKEELGAFVTFSHNGSLRGCIGSVVGQGPLYLTVARMARAAAFEDPRFPPITHEEFTAVDIEISIMGPITPCFTPEKIEIGRHGLLIRKGQHSGLLLPQVAPEWGWNREQFLEQTCMKAGLPPTSWKDSDAQLYWFEAYVF